MNFNSLKEESIFFFDKRTIQLQQRSANKHKINKENILAKNRKIKRKIKKLWTKKRAFYLSDLKIPLQAAEKHKTTKKIFRFVHIVDSTEWHIP